MCRGAGNTMSIAFRVYGSTVSATPQGAATIATAEASQPADTAQAAVSRASSALEEGRTAVDTERSTVAQSTAAKNAASSQELAACKTAATSNTQTPDVGVDARMPPAVRSRACTIL
eukprot:TRINITY_DN23869_c0_g1_i1.p1 TRINITY_DN23869_c0_g1~~TRINITY_DN23869_c0_g1_i1.p1  ORF type:complete len:117 (-),score=20.67 TRINITY_DN23869_c0_g1_i1:849-1199(-)